MVFANLSYLIVCSFYLYLISYSSKNFSISVPFLSSSLTKALGIGYSPFYTGTGYFFKIDFNSFFLGD